MKLLSKIIIIMVVAISCSGNDAVEDTIIEKPNLTGTWKPQRYEYKGKTYPLTECERKGQIVVNASLSGIYERYGVSASTGNCNLDDSFAGKWVYDEVTKDLTLTYNENGTAQTLKKEILDFSDNELKILDASKDLDNVPGNDEASLVFVKQ
ncbi:Lipocalin-like domain-containing protein [Chryseobacterium taichungense]|uniref:Lipocalin-like domain-containing protein n=1 Tax=Chryseobacterium taichungense TaxID=295069 RepID=A0A1H7W5E8_9FLAO|nr:lipocalin family protein [Chryseobacterium taichungense]SEM16554.1 Lipocalin-like domain-containing protein [Chryseobacterium taichungense]